MKAKVFRRALLIALATGLVPVAASAQEYLPGIQDKAQDAFRSGLSAALRKLPKCQSAYQILENGECCPPGHVSLGKTCARIAPNQCAEVAIEAPESCVLNRCAKYVRTVEKEEKVKGDDGKEETVKKQVEVPCQPWADGARDLTCELDTSECKKETEGQPPRWCGDWVKEVPATPQVDAEGKPIAGAPTTKIIRCKSGTEGCVLDVRECSTEELASGKSEGAGPCKVGQYIDPATNQCTAYGCPSHCATADGRCSKCGPDYKGAVDEFSKATSLDKRFYEAWFNLGMAYERLGKHAEAIKAYEAAKAIEPQDEREKLLQLSAQGYIARAMMGQARRYAEAGEADKAKAIREQARGIGESIRSVDADNTMANVALALYYLEAGDLKLAEEFVRQALRNNREDTIALNIRGLINLKQGKYEIARWILEEKVLALDPANAEGYGNLGLAYVQLGDLPRAVVAFKNAVTLNPESVSARLNLGAIYLEYLNYRDATRQYDAALKREPDNLEALTGYALALEGKREPKKAAEIYERVLAKDATRSAIIVRLALIYFKAPFNDGNKAISYWKRYLQAVGTDPASAQAQADALKVELDAARATLKTFEKAPKKAPADWATKKQDAVKKEADLATKWKNLIAIVSRIQAIEQGMELEKQAKEQGNKPAEPAKP